MIHYYGGGGNYSNDSGISSETMETRRKMAHFFEVLKEKLCQSNILDSGKILCRNKGRIQTFTEGKLG